MLGALVALPVEPASASTSTSTVESPVIQFLNDENAKVTPFVGEDFLAESAQTYQVGDPQATSDVCAVDFGDGTAVGGYWRAKYPPYAPCAQYHQYAATGTYKVTMTVTVGGVSAQSTRTIKVIDRPVYPRRGLLEGSQVTLQAQGDPSRVHWSTTGRDCRIDDPTATTTTVTCDNQGTYDIDFDGDGAGTSGDYRLSYVNGAPQPTLQPTRYRPGGVYAVSPRVGTGDDVLFEADGHDPSWDAYDINDAYPLYGDTLTCHFDFGDGVQGDDREPYSDACHLGHIYARAGTYTATVTVSDETGAAATTTTSVEVVRRDVEVSSHGHQAGGLSGFVRGSLNPAGLHGSMRFTTPAGRNVVVAKIEDLSVVYGSVTLYGQGTVNGAAGYSVFALVNHNPNKPAMQIYLKRGVRAGPGAYIEVVDAARASFATTYIAKPIS